ncbi:transcription termination factor NusA [Candidatus Dependentiae bacterium]|nr:transcription termination factor NusA [Candidatus Dependentiae bacterium]
MKLSQVIDELVEEKGLDRSVLSTIICEGMLSAYTKKYPDLSLSVNYNKKTDEIEVTVDKTVVQAPADESREISVRKARAFTENAQAGDVLPIPFVAPIGRIEIIKAKQVIAQKIRAIEYAVVYNEFKSKEGTIVHGVINKCERHGVTVKINDTFAFLPKSLSVPTDKCIVGYSIRALLKEVLLEPRNENQLILDRFSADFVKKLFEVEVPEIYEKLVEIKKIVRIPGYKTKLIVVSYDKNIDPVGTCVGVGGARIKAIGLGTEKIDIIAGTSSLDELIKTALKPAEVNRVELVDGENANVWVDDDQRSIAIGKMGQNIALASQLVGMQLHLIKSDVTDLFEEEEHDVNEEGFNQ